jgi:hypothetical protein
VPLFKVRDSFGCQVGGAEAMDEPSVGRSRKDILSETKLRDSPKALKDRSIEHSFEEATKPVVGPKAHNLVNRVSNDDTTTH